MNIINLDLLTKEFYEDRKNSLETLRISKIESLHSGPDGHVPINIHKEIARINFALKRVREGQYGLCVNCGVFIEKELLECTPETPFCLRCINKIMAH